MNFILREGYINNSEENLEKTIYEIINDCIGDNSVIDYLAQSNCRVVEKGEEWHLYNKMITKLATDLDIQMVSMSEDETGTTFPVSYIMDEDMVVSVYIGIVFNDLIGSLCIYSNVNDVAVGKISETIIPNGDEFIIDIIDSSIILPTNESFISSKEGAYEKTDNIFKLLSESYNTELFNNEIGSNMLDIIKDIKEECDVVSYNEKMVPIFINSNNEYLIDFQDITRLMQSYKDNDKECTEYMALQNICCEHNIEMKNTYVLIESKDSILQTISTLRSQMTKEYDVKKKQRLRSMIKKAEDKLSNLKKTMNIKIKKKKTK